jgi:divalent metal cation (Fe/Co/Zn/Cd) transporter
MLIQPAAKFASIEAGHHLVMPLDLPIVAQSNASSVPPPIPATRAADVRTALRLTYITLFWMTIEGIASITLGVLSNSILLEAFGIDSAIELFSALVLLWRLRVEAGGKADEARLERVERRASRLGGYALYVLALYVLASSVFGLVDHHVTDTHQSAWGILIGVVAAAGMPLLAKHKLKVAAPDRLNSKALRADAMEAFTCGYLSIVLIVALVATRLFGFWWLDSAAALFLIPLLIREGREAIQGECGCCHA